MQSARRRPIAPLEGGAARRGRSHGRTAGSSTPEERRDLRPWRCAGTFGPGGTPGPVAAAGRAMRGQGGRGGRCGEGPRKRAGIFVRGAGEAGRALRPGRAPGPSASAAAADLIMRACKAAFAQGAGGGAGVPEVHRDLRPRTSAGVYDGRGAGDAEKGGEAATSTRPLAGPVRSR